MANLRTEALRQTSNGNRLMTLEMPEVNPWWEWAATFDPADRMVQGWERHVEEYRQSIDEEGSLDPWAAAREKGMVMDPVAKDSWLSIAGTWDDETYEMFQQGARRIFPTS